MDKRRTVFVADVNNELRSNLVRELNQQPDLKVVGTASNGLDALRLIGELNPDIILLDVVLPKLDGMGVLRSLAEKAPKQEPVIIVMSFFVTEVLETHAASLGAHYYLVKPFELDSLVKLLRSQAQTGADVQVFDDTLVKITESLREMGVPSHIKGFMYTREAVVLTLHLPDSCHNVTKYIYPQVAKKFQTTPTRVERAIRHAIEVAWIRGDINVHYDLFRNSVSSERGKPTNSEFIATLADNLLLQKSPALFRSHPN